MLKNVLISLLLLLMSVVIVIMSFQIREVKRDNSMILHENEELMAHINALQDDSTEAFHHIYQLEKGVDNK